jgi:long-chain acyl-CoA synthetase
MTHAHIIADGAGILDQGVLITKPNDVYFSYLPSAHMFERALVDGLIFIGFKVAFYSGQVVNVRDDLKNSKPTLFPCVPRVLNKFYGLIQAKIKETTGFKRKLLEKAIKAKLYNLEKNGKLTHFLYDNLIFNKMKDIMGGKLRLIVCGGAPISQEVLDFLKICFCCPILEGYGLLSLILEFKRSN